MPARMMTGPRAVVRIATLTALLLCLPAPATAAPGDESPDGLAVQLDPNGVGPLRGRLPTAFEIYMFDVPGLAHVLESAPNEVPGMPVPESTVIYLPIPGGHYVQLAAVESPVISADLAAMYPGVHTYLLQGTRRRGITGRLTVGGPSGFHAVLRTPEGVARVAPQMEPSALYHLSHYERDRTDGGNMSPHMPGEHADDEAPEVPDLPTDIIPPPPTPSGVEARSGRVLTSRRELRPGRIDACDEPDRLVAGVPRKSSADSKRTCVRARQGLMAKIDGQDRFIEGFSFGGVLRTYRLVVTTSGEYYQARDQGGGAADVFASIVSEISNVNAVTEPELAIRLQLTAAIMFTDPTTDPWAGGISACALRDSNPGVVNAVIDPNSYDIGFAFGTGGGNGCAWYVLCQADKARGAGLVDPNVMVGGSTGLFLHEMGHQFGAFHTFSGSAGGCTAVEFNPGAGYAPGSGTTIMSYLNSCDSDNVSLARGGNGTYYHAASFGQILSNTLFGTGSTCGSSSVTGNIAPVVDAGADYTIPRDTPFVLTGMGSDADGDTLTYAWEQTDAVAVQRPIDTDLGDGPIFRSFIPSMSPVRIFPHIDDILENVQTKGEILPQVDRTLNFRLTARDGKQGGGGIGVDDTVITVSGDPFFITSPNGGETIAAGCPLDVAWTVGGGSIAPTVDLDLSTDGGSTFASLVAGTANDGMESGSTCEVTSTARVRASAVGNIFFDISDADFATELIPPTVSAAGNGGEVDENCEFEVPFSATVSDDCGISATDVTVDFIKAQNNFTLGVPTVNAMQVDATTVSVTGSVVVSDLMSSPAVLTIEVTGVDGCGAQDVDSVQVEIVDSTPPMIDVILTPDMLWPPNHKMRDISATVTVTDNCPGASFELVSVVSNEPDNGKGIGDGNTNGDIQGVDPMTPDVSFQLRAERMGTGSGRVYTATYRATDASSNETEATAEVVVPHNQ